MIEIAEVPREGDRAEALASLRLPCSRKQKTLADRQSDRSLAARSLQYRGKKLTVPIGSGMEQRKASGVADLP
jgi:hypothetical protein